MRANMAAQASAAPAAASGRQPGVCPAQRANVAVVAVLDTIPPSSAVNTSPRFLPSERIRTNPANDSTASRTTAHQRR